MKIMIKSLILISLGVISILKSQDFAVKNIPENLLKHANAVIRNESRQYTISSIDKMAITDIRTITILNKGGDDYSEIDLDYSPTSKISDIKVNILDENGKVAKTFTKKDFSDFSYVQSETLYTDSRVLRLRPISTLS